VATNLALDDKLIDEAVKAGNHRTKREAVTAALEEYVKLKRRLGLLEMVGQVDYGPKYDYKAERRRGNKRLPGGR
jgi:Arc/MetJ family transcription regulator